MNLNCLVFCLHRNVTTQPNVVVFNLFPEVRAEQTFSSYQMVDKKAKVLARHVYLILVQITNHEEADYEDYEYDGHHEVGRQETAHHL